MFTKYFNPSNIRVNQPRDVIYARRFLGQLLQKPDDFLQHVRTYVPIYRIFSKHAIHFVRVSFVGSTTLSMTYSINVQPYNDPYVKIVEEALVALSAFLTPSAFLVDIIPILKYFPEWFPGAKFQSKVAALRKHAEMMRNTTFAATEKLMVCYEIHSSHFLGFLLYERIRSQASGDYDPSFATEVLLKEIQNSDTPTNQDINLLKDVAVAAYVG